MSKNKKTQNRHHALTGSHKQLSFFPEPEFNPILPRRGTLVYRALCKLLRGEKFTQYEFLLKIGSWHLAVFIEILKNKLGWPVQSCDAVYIPLADPRKRDISTYFFDEEIIQKFKELIGGVVWW